SKAWFSQNVSVFFKNSLLYSIISVSLLIFVCAPASYALSRFKFATNKLIQNGFVAAMGVPVVMVILPLFSSVSRMNLLNSDTSIRILMIFLYVGINVPYTTIFLLTFFGNLSKSYEEAAAIDGSGPIRTFWKIMLPLAQPGIVTVSIFNFINIWNEYFMSLIFANSNSTRPVAVGLYSMINSMKYTGDWAGMFASVIIVFLPTFILYLFLSEKIIAGVTGGGIKG
ncbi:MAG: carbohydrate ABC transporter permease, partial [Christensenellales bacterium]